MPSLQPAMSTTDAAGDLFLSGGYIELGISSYGNFGTSYTETPAGYAVVGSQGVGLTYNQAGFGVNSSIPTIDFFTPGTPFEAFSAGYTQGAATTQGYNYKDGSNEGITSTSLTNTSSGSTLAAEWIGTIGALRVTIDYSFGANDLYFATKVTLTNTSATAMTDARYARTVDPDNTEYVDGTYDTINTVVSQTATSGASEVTAASQTSGTYYSETGQQANLVYYSNDPNSFVGIDTADNPYDVTAGAVGQTNYADDRIFIEYDGGALAAGASKTFTYYTALTGDIAAVVAAVSAPAIGGIATGTATGNSAADLAGNATANPTATVYGTGNSGDTVTISDGTTVLGTASVGSNGRWTFTTPALGDGEHDLTATATSNGHTSPAYALDIDTPPELDNVVGLSPYDARPPITGTAAAMTPAGTTVSVYDGTTLLGTTTTDALGHWSFTPPTDLAVGAHLISATETVGSVTSGASIPSAYAVLASPAISGLAPGAAVGSSAADLAGTATANQTPTIGGTGNPGDVLTVRDGATVLGTATVAGNGTWSFTAPVLADGTHALSATAGAGGPSATASLVIDAPGTLTGAGSLGAHASVDGRAPITGVAAAGSPVGSTISITADGTLLGTTTTTDAAGDWLFTPATALGIGHHVLTATETAGGVTSGASDAYAFTQLPPAPGALALAPSSGPGAGAGASNVFQPVVTGTGLVGETVRLFDGTLNVGTATVGSNGRWSITTALLGDGSHDLTATETTTDGIASPSSDPLSVLIDTVGPAISASLADDTGSSDADGLTDDAALHGTTEAGDTVTISENNTVLATTTAAADGTWSVAGAALALADGAHRLVATATDEAGNQSNVAVAFTLDTTPPTVALATANLLADTPQPSLSGTAEAGSTVQLLLDGQAAGSVVANAAGTWTATLAGPVATGTHLLTATGTDAAGNVSAPTLPAHLVVTTTPTAGSNGTSTADLSSLTFSQLTGQNYSTDFTPGTEAVTLSDGTLSVGPDTEASYVERLYRTLLGRHGDTPGFTGWTAQSAGGSSNDAIAGGFLGAVEATGAGSLTDTQFVGMLYQNALGRTPATAETDFWTGALSSGVSRATVLADIADSPEAKAALAGDTSLLWVPDANAQLVTFTYETALGRAPETGGLEFWQGNLKGGMTVAQFMDDFVQTPEFKAVHGNDSAAGLVSSLYENGLGRAPTAGELQVFTADLQNGSVTAAGLLNMVATSTEAYKHLATTL